jgi:predicted SprT family Zn-dependent metalloprotease
MASPDGPARLSYVERMTEALLKTHGLHDWTFKWDRAVTRYGCCHHTRKKITLSRYYVISSNISFEEIRNVILHEIAHALAGYAAGHGDEWKKAALAIGCDAQVTSDKWASALPRPIILVCPCLRNRLARFRITAKIRRSVCKHCKMPLMREEDLVSTVTQQRPSIPA